MYKYAQINEENICISVSDLSGIVENPSMILIDNTINPLGKKYVNETWEEIPEPEKSIDELRANAYATLVYKEDGTAGISHQDTDYTFDQAILQIQRYEYLEEKQPNQGYQEKADSLTIQALAFRDYIHDVLYPRPDIMTISDNATRYIRR